MFASRTDWRLEPNLLTQALARHRQSGRVLLDLTASNPTTCGFAYPQENILASLADPRVLTYAPESKGRPDARSAVAEYYRGRAGFAGAGSPGKGVDMSGKSADVPGKGTRTEPAVDPERIILLSGTSEGYSHLFRLLCEPGDEILVPAPSYPLFEFLADLNDVRLTTYPLLYDHGWHLDLHSLRQAMTTRVRAVMVVHPNNPTGSFVKSGEAAALVEICAAHDAAIVADEVFLDFSSEDMHESFAFGTAALTFTLSGLSKICALPQMKLAWIVVSGPEELARAATERLEVIADTYLSPGTPVQLATPELLARRGAMQEQVQRRVAANLAFLDTALRAETGPVTRLVREGGWYAVLRVPSAVSDETVAVELLERFSVLVHPGNFFNLAQNGFLVLSLIAPENDFQEGCRRLQQFFG
jgi:aspartate/methionine/tyrosine aminotransferase